MNMYNEASNEVGICAGMSTETQIVGVICNGSVSDGAWSFVVVVVVVVVVGNCVAQK
jgi:hypothetical protein